MLTEVVAGFIREEANANPLITVTRLDIAPNYRNVNRTLHYNSVQGQDDARIFLMRKGGDLRGYTMKHSNMKVVPFLLLKLTTVSAIVSTLMSLPRRLKRRIKRWEFSCAQRPSRVLQ